MNVVEEYLKKLNQEELIHLLSNIPEIKKYVNEKLDAIQITNLLQKLPQKLFSNYMLALNYNGKEYKELAKWIKDNMDGMDSYILIEYFTRNNK